MSDPLETFLKAAEAVLDAAVLLEEKKKELRKSFMQLEENQRHEVVRTFAHAQSLGERP